jgi:hypothetical protein
MLEYCALPLAQSRILSQADAVRALAGFSIRDDLFVWFGNSKFVTIERGALEPYVSDMATFLPALNKAADEAGLLHYD